MGLAKRWGAREKFDDFIYKLHEIPTAALNRYFNWSMYRTARTHAIAGYLSLAAYLGSAISLVATDSEKLDSIDKVVIAGSALLFGALSAWIMRRNYNEASLAEVREQALIDRNAHEAFVAEEEDARDQGIPQAKWYGFSFTAWSAIMGTYAALGSIDITDPKIITMIIAAMGTTTGVFGPHYELKTGYKSQDKLENLIRANGGRQYENNKTE